MVAPLNPLSVYPSCRGLTLPIIRIPTMRSNIQQCVSGKESSVVLWSYPRWTYKLSYSFLTQLDYDKIVNFFLSHRGRAIPFWLSDDKTPILRDEIIGVADGVTKNFQISRRVGDIIEPIFGTKIDMVVTSSHQSLGYYIQDGMVMFQSAPPKNTGNITVYGSYYIRVRFSKDEVEMEEFMHQLHESKSVELITVK